MERWQAYFTGDPNENDNLTMEISCDKEIMAIVRRRAAALDVDFYPVSSPVSIPLEWLLDKLQVARHDLLKEGVADTVRELHLT